MLDVGIGRNRHTNKVIRLPWDGNIGAFIAGRPGSGKSHVIASLLTQYAIKGVAIVIAEYNADPDNKESLIYRTRHIHHVFQYPAATTGKEVESLILWLEDELKQRQTAKKAKTPLVVVLDEFFAFSNTFKPKVGVTTWKEGDASSEEGETRITQKTATYWEKLTSIQSDLRKNNIRLIVAVQEPAASAGSTMRQVRDMFRYRLIMNLGTGAAKLLGIEDKASQNIVMRLAPGYIFLRDIEDIVIGVPYPINPEWIALTHDIEPVQAQSIPVIEEPVPLELYSYDWTPEDTEMYLDALFKYWNNFESICIDSADISARIDTKEDLIGLLVLMGKNNSFIINSISGRDDTKRQLIAQYRAKYNKE